MKTSSFALLRLLMITLSVTGGADAALAQEASTPASTLALVDFASPDAGKQVVAAKGVPAGSTVVVDKTGITASFAAWEKGDADHPAFHVTPAAGKSWDLSAYGHVEVVVKNTGDRAIKFNVHVVPTGEGFWTEKNQEGMELQAGETKTVKVIFGYSKGFKPAPPINSASIAEIFVFLYHSGEPHSFLVSSIVAAGKAGEKPAAASP